MMQQTMNLANFAKCTFIGCSGHTRSSSSTSDSDTRCFVMPGLDAGVHAEILWNSRMDCRDKPGNDEEVRHQMFTRRARA